MVRVLGRLPWLSEQEVVVTWGAECLELGVVASEHIWEADNTMGDCMWRQGHTGEIFPPQFLTRVSGWKGCHVFIKGTLEKDWAL